VRGCHPASGWGRFADRIPQDLYVVAVGVPEVEGAASVPVVSRAVVDDDATLPHFQGELIYLFLFTSDRGLPTSIYARRRLGGDREPHDILAAVHPDHVAGHPIGLRPA